MTELTGETVPRLDTVEFDDLVEQARAVIPRFAPGWTDHNLHDPGITLIDLLAWLVDQQVYRAGHVGGLHQRAFAALLGTRQNGPEPARGLVWPRRSLVAERSIAPDSAVSCPRHPDLRFALDTEALHGRRLHLTPAALERVGLVVGGVEQPPPPARLDRGSWRLGDSGGMAGTVLSLAFDRPLGAQAENELLSLGFEVAPPPGPPLSSEDPPWGPLRFEYRVGSGPWVRVDVVGDGTAGMARSGAVLLALPSTDRGKEVGSELRICFDQGFFPVPPQLRGASINVLPVVQREKLGPALLASGTGQPDQVVELDTTGLVPSPARPGERALAVAVGKDQWQERADLTGSGPKDQHFLVRGDHLLFGNGVNGCRPPYGAPITHLELARTRAGAGNVRAGLSWSVPTIGAEGADVGVNREPFSGGRDASDGDSLAIAAQSAATSRSALLTDAEMVAAAYGLSGMAVARAEVIAGFDRRLPDRRVEGVRTLVVVPHDLEPADGGPRAATSPVPQAYLSHVAARLAHRRVLGERLVVQGPRVVAVDLWLSVAAEAGSVAGAVTAAVERALKDRLSPTSRSVTGPWPLGRDLTSSDVEAVAANVPGVVTVTSVRMATAGSPADGGPVRVPRDGLVVADGVDVVVETADPRHEHDQSHGQRPRGTRGGSLR